MASGWIKAHRAMLEHPLLEEPDAFTFWMRLLLMAAHKPTTIRFKGQSINLARGQCVCVLADMARKLGITRQRMRTLALRHLNGGMLSFNPAQGQAFTVVTICNYDIYQGSDEADQPSPQPSNNPATTQLQPTEQEEKKDKKEDSAPSERAAKPPKDARSHLWQEMKSAIRGCDASVGDPGKLVGKWIANSGGGLRGEAFVFAAHLEATEREPAHYLTWMHKQCGRKSKTGPPSPADIEAEAMRILNSRNGQTDEPDEEAAADYGGADEAPRRYEAAGQFH